MTEGMQLYTGDLFILNFIMCPNCNGRLAPRSQGKWINVGCETCAFGCRFVSARCSPESPTLHASPDQLEDLLTDAKELLPPIIMHFRWRAEGMQHEKVIFYPFLAYRFLKEEQDHVPSLSPEEEARVFYNLFEVPCIVLFESPTDEDIARMVCHMEIVSTSYIQRVFSTGYSRASTIRERALELRKLLGITESDDQFDTGPDSVL